MEDRSEMIKPFVASEPTHAQRVLETERMRVKKRHDELQTHIRELEEDLQGSKLSFKECGQWLKEMDEALEKLKDV